MANLQLTTVEWVLLAIVLLLLISVTVVLLWRSGWQLKNLKKIKIANVELERFNPKSKSDSGTPQEQQPTIISIQVSESTFEGSVGDIGGIIAKQSPTDENKSSGRKRERKARR